MLTVYIAGPYRPRKWWQKLPVVKWFFILRNIRRARKVGLGYWKLGYATIIPHSNTALFDGKAPDSVWLEGDLELLKRCDIVVMMDGWQESLGAVDEHEAAKKWGKCIIYDKEES